MKLKRKLLGVAGFLTAAIGSQAAIFDWQFSNSANPAEPTGVTENPSGAAGTATIDVGSGAGYDGSYLQAVTGDLGPVDAKAAYGDRTGIWSTSGGSYKLDIAAYTATPGAVLNYTVAITEFVGTASTLWAFPGTYNISLGAPISHTGPLPIGVAGTEGGWFTDTYTFSITPGYATPLSLTITPTVATDPLYLDSITWKIEGDLALAPVPEPMLTQSLAAAGLVAFGFWARSRRKS